jgi:hypothetical protein
VATAPRLQSGEPFAMAKRGFEAYRRKKVRFFSIEEWGEEGARQFAETQVGVWENSRREKPKSQ